MRDPNPVVYLVPGVGMLTFARDKATARIAAEFYVNAINVMRGAAGVDRYVGLPSRRRSTSSTGCSRRRSCSACPSPRRWPGRWRWSPAGPAASAAAVARRLLAEGACVVLTDIDAEALAEARARLRRRLRRATWCTRSRRT